MTKNYFMEIGNWRYVTNKSVPNVIENRYIVNEHGDIYDTYNAEIIKQMLLCNYNSMYKAVRLRCNNKYGSTNVYVHRIVKIEFHGFDNDVKKIRVIHIDGNNLNNELSNLKWENPSKIVLNNIENFNKKIVPKEDDIRKICIMLKKGKSIKEISNYFKSIYNKNLKNSISNIYNLISWTHISKDYLPFPPQKKKKIIFISHHQVIDEYIAEDICEKLQSGMSTKEVSMYISDKYKINRNLRTIVYQIKKRISWKNISCKYDF